MTSYGLEERFKTPKTCFRLEDPGAYSHPAEYKFKINKCGFLSSAPRVTQCWRIPYTDKVYMGNYNAIFPPIPNATSLKSTTPRFSYGPLTEEELEEILCRCGIERSCVCPVEQEKECQANAYKRLFKGPPPHCALGTGLSVPTKRDHGFEILHDGSTRRLLDVPVEQSPSFYDARVHHSPEFYQGCKWSHWKAPRVEKSLEVRPGPADYTIERKLTKDELCAEKVRADRRKKSKQLRYIEIIQNRNILEGRPGPSDYNPQQPRGTDLNFLGPKAPRFETAHEQGPSPASYSVKRNFDPPEPPERPCVAKLPAPAGFNVKAPRFKDRIQESPGPGDYDARAKLCKVLNCSTAPFGCSALRFVENKPDIIEVDDEDIDRENEETETRTCPTPTWQFKSRTKRFRTLKQFDIVVPCLTKPKVKKPVQQQYLAPFDVSEARFQRWYDWLPVHSGFETPGPGYYNLSKPKCYPAFKVGPLYRTRRFIDNKFNVPAPNEYTLDDTVLKTHNTRLQSNTKQRSERFKWIPPKEPTILSIRERELIILNRAIKQCETNDSPVVANLDADTGENKDIATVDKTTDVDKEAHTDDVDTQVPKPKQKLLRTFLYNHPMSSAI